MRLLIDIIKTEAEKIPNSFWEDIKSLEIVSKEITDLDKELVLEETLVICDDSDRCDYYRSRGAAILVYLFSENKEQNFSGYKWIIESFEGLDVGYLEKVYKREKKLPLSILNTKRLFVRETTESDVPVFYQLYQEPSITEYMEKLFDDPEEELAYTRNYRVYIYEFYDFGMWTVLEKESGFVIGRAGISMREGFEDLELGFMIGKAYQRKGYAYEVCSAILEYAKKEFDFDKVTCLVKEENRASLCLCKKLGFEKKGIQKIGKEEYCYFIKNLEDI